MKNVRPYLAALALSAAFVVSGEASLAQNVANDVTPVSFSEDANNYTLSNGIMTAKIAKRSGDLVSLMYRGAETLDATSGHPGGYWSHSAASPNTTTAITLDPIANGGQRGEVAQGEAWTKVIGRAGRFEGGRGQFPDQYTPFTTLRERFGEREGSRALACDLAGFL